VTHHRVVVIGAGFGGIGASIKLAEQGIEHVIVEKMDDVGGTWWANKYPGCRCDVPSHLYSFSFALNPDWSNTYSEQPEIHRYLRKVAEDYGVIPRVRFNTTVNSARWDNEARHWALDTSAGTLTADAVITAHGFLSEPAIPDIKGLDTFGGQVMHSAQWDPSYDVTGKRVAVIGTGASAVQIVPRIHETVRHLYVFQRTAAWILPHRARPIRDWERKLYRRAPLAQRVVRNAVYYRSEFLFLPALLKSQRLDVIRKMALEHLESQVPDPELRKQDGTLHELDVIILATGFRVTDNTFPGYITGRDGRTLREVWDGGSMGGYNGTTFSGFPNLFMLAGPNTGIGHTSLVYMIEAQFPYILQALKLMEERGIAALDVRPDVQEAFNEELQRKLVPSVWLTGGCSSWYLDKSGRNSTIWPDFTFNFAKRLKRFDLENYYQELTPAPATPELVAV